MKSNVPGCWHGNDQLEARTHHHFAPRRKCKETPQQRREGFDRQVTRDGPLLAEETLVKQRRDCNMNSRLHTLKALKCQSPSKTISEIIAAQCRGQKALCSELNTVWNITLVACESAGEDPDKKRGHSINYRKGWPTSKCLKYSTQSRIISCNHLSELHTPQQQQQRPFPSPFLFWNTSLTQERHKNDEWFFG